MIIKKVVVTGPESTGKTELAGRLASIFNTVWIPEYAREYILSLDRKYSFDDVEHIAREQLRLGADNIERSNGLLFFDTYLIVTKVWFKVVYGNYPEWIDYAISESGIDLFLVCNTDLPWVPDPVRENGGEMRAILLNMYISEIESFKIPWKMVSGSGDKRVDSAVEMITGHFNFRSIPGN